MNRASASAAPTAARRRFPALLRLFEPALPSPLVTTDPARIKALHRAWQLRVLVGTIATNLATRRAAASSVGLVGLFGYLSTMLSGWGLGKRVQTYGWDLGFAGMIGVAGLGTGTCLIGWNAKPHGYATETEEAVVPKPPGGPRHWGAGLGAQGGPEA